MRLIDAHAHVNFDAYKNDADEVIRRALDADIGMFAVGTQTTTSERAIETAERYENVWAVIGLHPIHLHEREVDEDEVQFKSREEEFDAGHYRRMAASSKKVVALGECGLDYFHVPEGIDLTAFKRSQEEAFRAHADLALELDLPLMIHCRDAHADLAAIIESYDANETPLRGQIHCFTGTVAEAQRYLAAGFHISFTGIITFPPRKPAPGQEIGETLLDVVRAVPMDKIIVETDAPYLAPVPHRGKRNEPLWVSHVAEKVAEVKELPFEDVARATLENTKKLYRI